MDEIYISPQLNFKGGRLIGSSFDQSNALAKTAQVFSIASAFSNYKDVVAILPLYKNNGELLHRAVSEIIKSLHELDLYVLSIISDDNAINKSMFGKFKKHIFGFGSVCNPANSIQPLFLIYDPVHIFKNIRNNWISLSSYPVFDFPDIDDPNIIRKADFTYLRQLYEREKSSVIKYGHKLSYKSLYPSNIEKQKVSLVLKVFNDANIAAINHFFGDSILGTWKSICFIKIIIKWWNIVNVKSCLKHVRFINESVKLIESID